MKSRRLKVRGKLDSHTMDTVPLIRLQGRWLENLGFKEGQVVVVEEAEEKITIRVNQGLVCKSEDLGNC